MIGYSIVRRWSETLSLTMWATAIWIAAAGFTPVLAQTLTLRDTPIGAADGAIETIAGWGSADGAVFKAAAVDLNGDGAAEWIVRVEHMYQCRRNMEACRTYVMHREPGGGWDGIAYPYAREVSVLKSRTNGFYDLDFDGDFYAFDGEDYREGTPPVTTAPPATTKPSANTEPPATTTAPQSGTAGVSGSASLTGSAPQSGTTRLPGATQPGRVTAAAPIMGGGAKPDMAALAARFGSDCESVDMAKWSHPTRDVFAATDGARIKWLVLCENRTFPVFGATFKYDPRGQTDDFFYPFYLDLLEANGRWPYAIYDADDNVVVRVARSDESGLFVDLEEIKAGDNVAPATLVPDSACATYDMIGEVSLCAPDSWSSTVPQTSGGPARRIQLQAPDGHSSLFVDWLYPEGDPQDDFDTISAEPVSLGGVPAMRYVSVIGSGDAALYQVLAVVREPDAEGRQLTFLFETTEADAAVMLPVFERILSTIRIGRDAALPTANAEAAPPPVPSPPPPPTAEPPAAETAQVLFAGDGLGTLWQERLETKRKADFEDVAHFDNGELVVDVPAGTSWGQVGLTSKDAVLWLDQFGPGAEKRLTFRFDPDKTTGLAVALSNKNESKSFVVKWVRLASEGRTVLQIFIDSGLACNPDWPVYAEPVWEQEVPDTAPGEITLTLRPGTVTLTGDGLPEHQEDWDQMTPDAGLWLHAYSFPELYDGAAKMALTGITLEDTVLAPVEPPQPEPGVDPLPVRELFGPDRLAPWELTPWQAGSTPETLCTLDRNGFAVLHGPGDDSHSDGCDIHSVDTLLNLDDRLQSALYTLTLQFDPQATRSFRVVLPTTRRGDQRWVKSTSTREIVLARSERDPAQMVLDCAELGQREVSPDWLRAGWTGALKITIGKDWMRCSLQGGPAVRVDTAPASGSYIYVVAADYHYPGTDPALRLTRITGQWALTHPMTADERWRYLDDDDFDPAAFVDDLAAELGVTSTAGEN